MNSEPSAPAVTGLKWTARTHAGRFRRNNEDAFLILRFDDQEQHYLGMDGESEMAGRNFIFAVSDGMGGENVGEVASGIVLRTITNLISREFHQKAPGKNVDCIAVLQRFCEQIHAEVERVGRYYDETRGMGATLSLGWFRGNDMHFAHVGDSRIYHVPAGQGITQLSEDHTVVGRLRRAGKLNEREARCHPDRNLLERAVGGGFDTVAPQLGGVAVRPGDRFVFCSDGITDGIWDNKIEGLVRNPPAYLNGLTPAQQLLREAMDTSGRDNLTAIVVDACG